MAIATPEGISPTSIIHTWKANGLFDTATTHDGERCVDELLYIKDLRLMAAGIGSSGTVIVDIQISTNNGTSWATVCSTKAQVTTTATAGASIGIGETVTGFTAPVLSTTAVPANSLIRMNIDQVGFGFTDMSVALTLGR